MKRGNSSSSRRVEDLTPPTEPTPCPCECHRVTHEARKPHPNTMAGRP